MIGLLVLLGYALGVERAWRLAPSLSSIHPLTAMCIVLLGLGFQPAASHFRFGRMAARAAVSVVAALLLLRLSEPLLGSRLLHAITPFQRLLAAQAAGGKPVIMGLNAVCAIFLIAIAEILRWRRSAVLSQTLACCAIGIMVVALTGYIDGLPRFHGRMSPQTITGAILLAVVVLFATPRHGFMRTLTARSEPGRVARLLLGFSTPLVLLIGWVMSRFLRTGAMNVTAAETFLAYQTALVILLTWVLVTVAATRAERIDQGRRMAEARLLKAANIDALTGLLSRNRMEQLRSGHPPNQPPAITAKLFIDLDRFRSVNEAFGHGVGDDVLVEVGRRLRGISGSHALGRVGGDEFAIDCAGISLQEAEQIGVAVTTALAAPFKVGPRSFRLTASVGLAHNDTSGETDLRQAADSAMHVAKQRGGNQSVPFAASMHADRRRQIELEQDLYEALSTEDQLTLVYQPVIRLADHKLIAVEALARWMHPQLGPIPPDRFIKLAEATGLILPLGLKLMASAIHQAAQWRVPQTADLPVINVPVINVNVSPVQFASGDVIGDLMRMVRNAGLPSSAVCIEVTEGAFTDERAIQALATARQAGFTVAMDDFGVGYSSLSQLPRLPLASVKIDRSFILDATATSGGTVMLMTIVQLAHSLGLTVIAEGVETQEQLDLVRRAGCDAVQGYVFAKPLDADQLELWQIGRPQTVAAGSSICYKHDVVQEPEGPAPQ